ncbi:S8 family peptidase [Paenibacillus polymyxa]|uniref:S8 family peptidase n=1 Tax=Paenibacillus polymyxa TaxID=1406 RepID=UPI002AB5AE4D|nr:S8 family peptidase [Paenibacillus polymyxa]MDY8022019.1 S8 family peptidase [Paenibacillus polymyxa]
MKVQETTNQVPTNIDPRIQRVIAFSLNDRAESDRHNFTTDTHNEQEIAVIAKVNDIEKWEQLAGVRQIADLGSVPDEKENVRLVTARVVVNKLEEVRNSPIVMSIKASQPLKPQLFRTIEETKARVDLLEPDTKSNGGKGVIVGIIDYGCDFTHHNFINPDGTSRILSYWDQTAIASRDTAFGYGQLFTQEQLSNALKTQDPFATLNIPDPKKESGPWHGTHVMDIAAGNGKGTKVPGVAPQADIVFVQLNANDVPWMGAEAVEGNFGGSVHLLEALQYIFQFAGDRPCVTNISLGTNGGPHDGTSLVETGLDTILHNASNRAIVLAASNSFSDGIHASGTVRQNETKDIHWIVDRTDYTFNEIELWYDKNDEFICEIITPQGKNLGKFRLGTNHQVLGDQNQIQMFISHRKNDPNNGDNVINIFMESRSTNWDSTGRWTIKLHGVRVHSGNYHAWIERDDQAQSQFETPLDNTHTLGSICCGKKSIVVGSYSAKTPDNPISFFSSAGPTRDGRQKPEISAPGGTANRAEPEELMVKAAASGTLTGATFMMGTSMAAPAVTGIIALMLAEAQAHDIKLNIDEIRQILETTARPMASGWHDRYGFGRINANKAVKKVADMVPVH